MYMSMVRDLLPTRRSVWFQMLSHTLTCHKSLVGVYSSWWRALVQVSRNPIGGLVKAILPLNICQAHSIKWAGVLTDSDEPGPVSVCHHLDRWDIASSSYCDFKHRCPLSQGSPDFILNLCCDFNDQTIIALINLERAIYSQILPIRIQKAVCSHCECTYRIVRPIKDFCRCYGGLM